MQGKALLLYEFTGSAGKLKAGESGATLLFEFTRRGE